MEQLQQKWGGVGAFKVQSFLLFLWFKIVAHSEYLSIKLEVTEFESVHYSSCFVGLENREEEVFNGT